MGDIITLTTDFGLSDGYVAAMKGVILGLNPGVRMVDICHTVPPQDIARAAFLLNTACPFFPEGTIHLVVVDPGVGTGRKAIILKTPAAFFIAPDNGVLSYVVRSALPQLVTAGMTQVSISPPLQAVAITVNAYWRSPVSATFHGRDVFAPVAAYLSLGVPLREFGEEINTLAVLPRPGPQRGADGVWVARIIHIDSFGNIITDFRGEALTGPARQVTVEIGRSVISGLSRTYGDGTGLLALIGSSSYLEIAVNGGDAARSLGAAVGDEVRVGTG